jgi:hypothetical protein
VGGGCDSDGVVVVMMVVVIMLTRMMTLVMMMLLLLLLMMMMMVLIRMYLWLPSLSLPEEFGRIYLGETFSAYVSMMMMR